MSTENVSNESLDYVLYTDGGSAGDHKAGGCGVHGYAHTREIAKKGSGAKYTPSAEGYLRTREKAREVELAHYVDSYRPLGVNVTNNDAELTGLIEALNILYERTGIESINSAILYLDSNYCVQGVNEYLDNWKSNGWKKSTGEEIANRSHWENIDALLTSLRSQIKLDIRWLRGHDGDLGNYYADLHATRARILAHKGLDDSYLGFTSPQGYWKYDAEPNRSLSKMCWYFNTNVGLIKSCDGRYVYHLGDHGDDDAFIGKRISNASFAVAFTQEPDPALETLRQAQEKQAISGQEEFIIGRLNLIQQQRYRWELLTTGDKFIVADERRGDLYTADNRQLTCLMRPARLAFRCAEMLTSLEHLLEAALDPGNSSVRVVSTDVSPYFYESHEGKKKTTIKLADGITNTTRRLTLPVNYDTGRRSGELELGLCLGMDLPSRNNLSALCEHNPRVEIITWRESDHAFRYASIIHAGGDSVLHASAYSNIYLLEE